MVSEMGRHQSRDGEQHRETYGVKTGQQREGYGVGTEGELWCRTRAAERESYGVGNSTKLRLSNERNLRP